MAKYILTKAQVWSLDVLIAFIIFIVGMIFFYLYIINYQEDVAATGDKIEKEGFLMTDQLLTSGSPENWTENNVQVPGIADQNRINITKLNSLFLLAQFNYTLLKQRFNVVSDFYIFFPETLNLSRVIVDGIGKPGLNRTTIFSVENPDSLVKVSRIVVLDNKLTKLKVYVWRKSDI
jgi:hypothetical protein